MHCYHEGYKQELQEKERLGLELKRKEEDEELKYCSFKPETIELPPFIQDYLERTKDLRYERKELKKLLEDDEEDKPRWVYN
mmetsp:Transcript_21973/g.19528  ORF Transcript_21973/g.19528 Transcript_21973/m.19528 type:complete len:82 (+) Transcript_21973:146-391(+)